MIVQPDQSFHWISYVQQLTKQKALPVLLQREQQQRSDQQQLPSNRLENTKVVVARLAWRGVFKEICLQNCVDTVGKQSCSALQNFLQQLPAAAQAIAQDHAVRRGYMQSPKRANSGLPARQQRSSYPTHADIEGELTVYMKQREEAMSRARLKALKENDADAYLLHLQQTKISSLLHIMEVTHTFMINLGAQLSRQQQDGELLGEKQRLLRQDAHDGGVHTTTNNNNNSTKGKGYEQTNEYLRFKEYVASTKDEYRLVHKESVFVEHQPKGLYATLMPHQIVGLRFLASLHANNINGLLADEMGVGKTIQTLSFLLYLKECNLNHGGGRHTPHLVLAPLSIIREWKEACESFVRDSMRVAEFSEVDPLTLGTDYDLILLAVHKVRNVAHVLNTVRWGYVVVDEAHKAVSNLATITAQAICAIPFQHRLVLTGTPLNSDLQELWSLLHFINPRIFSEMSSFDDVFRRPFYAVGDAGDAAHATQLTDEERALLVMRMHQVLRPFMLRRTKKDIDSTLRITFHDVRCPLTAVQTWLLEQLRTRKQLPAVVDGRCVSRNVLTVESAAQSICNHPFMIPFFSRLLHMQREPRDDHRQQNKNVKVDLAEMAQEEHDDAQQLSASAVVSDDADEDQRILRNEATVALACSGKFLILDLILRRARCVGVKTVVFTHWLDCMDLLVEYFEAQGWHNEEDYVVLNGSSSADERKACVDRFRSNPKCFIFLVSMKAGGCGLNLQVAHLIVMLDKDYTGTNEDQAIARVFRIGQKNIVRALQLVTDDESERRIIAIAEKKNKPRHAIIEGGGYHVEATDEDRQEAVKGALVPRDDVEIIDVSQAADVTSYTHRFDALIVPELAVPNTTPDDDGRESDSTTTTELSVAQVLANNVDECIHRSAVFATMDEVPPSLRLPMESVNAPEQAMEDLGRGKRERQELKEDDMPPDYFWNRLADDGLDDEDIRTKWRMKCEKERELQRLCSVTFSSKTVEIDVMEKRSRRMPVPVGMAV